MGFSLSCGWMLEAFSLGFWGGVGSDYDYDDEASTIFFFNTFNFGLFLVSLTTTILFFF